MIIIWIRKPTKTYNFIIIASMFNNLISVTKSADLHCRILCDIWS